MTPAGILETAIYARDLDAAEAFYGGLLALERIARVEDRHVFYKCGDGVLLVFNPDETVKPPAPRSLPVPPHGATGDGHVCFRASEAEIDRWKAHFAEAGIEIESEFEWPQGGRSIYLRDPAGNSVEFANPSIWGL
ncbi:MAG: VOC family protein [Rhizobiaceae bacterium]|nr:VOC family protein [Rhizobiaceae bacterium]